MKNNFTKVLVTGANGYVASWLVKKLLKEGYEVNAAVRNPEDDQKNKHLTSLKNAEKLTLFKADLLVDGTYEEAMKGCEVVFHTASPFILNVADNQKDLVDPALEGTRNVLSSVNKVESVKRVVLTSSVAAIYGDNIDAKDNEGHIVNEEFWNTSSTVNHQPYSYSKVVAEKLAWDIQGKQNRWDLVVINPSLVFGPTLGSNPTSESFTILKQLGDGTFKSGAPELHLGIIDVRDLAEAHFKAAFNKNANGRNIISGHSTTILNVAKVLKQHFTNSKVFPSSKSPKFLIWILAPFVGLDRKFVSRNFGHKVVIDNSKSIKELEMNYTDLKTTLVDTFDQLYENGVIEKK